jgi:hypothetical protein
MFSYEVYNLVWFYYTQVGALEAPKLSKYSRNQTFTIILLSIAQQCIEIEL